MAIYQRNHILKDLKTDVIELTIEYPDHGKRVVRVTHIPQLLPSNVLPKFIDEKHASPESGDQIIAWAVDMKSWFVFTAADVRYAQTIEGYM